MGRPLQLSLLKEQVPPGSYLEAWADIDPSGLYRYCLGRTWDRAKPRVLFAMLNPSKADGHEDDATIRVVVGYARRWDFGSLEVVNLYAWRSTDPRALKSAADPVGCENDRRIEEAVGRAQLVVAAWGAHAGTEERARAVVELIRKKTSLYCLALTGRGAPHHPLRLSAHLKPQLFVARAAPEVADHG